MLSKEQKLQNEARIVLNKFGYKDYLDFEWWKLVRARKLSSTNHKCEKCGDKATQVHHKHYKTLSKETNDDLISICGPCHQHIHQDILDMNAHLTAIARGGLKC